jgi:hypothetical protein
MNATIKKVVDEIIFICTNWRSQDFSTLTIIKNAIDQSNAEDIFTSVRGILSWAKEVILSSEIDEEDNYTENYFLIDDDDLPVKHEFIRFKVLFDNCPEIKEFLKLEEGKVSFNDDLTVEERKEIHQYIHENYQMQLRWRIKTKKE